MKVKATPAQTHCFSPVRKKLFLPVEHRDGGAGS